MATMITSECINCGACEPECPNTAIYQGGVEWQAPDNAMHPAISNDVFYIVPEKCTECVGFHDHEACAAVCPVDCCVPNPDIPETHDVLLTRARALHPGDSIPDDAPSRFKKEDAAAAPAAAPAANGHDAAPAPAAAPAAPKPAAAPAAARPSAVVRGRVEKPVARPAPARPARSFAGELPGSYEQLLADLGTPRRRVRSRLALLPLALLKAGQGFLGALPPASKERLEGAVSDRRFFNAQLATAANLFLNLVVYPVVCLALAVGAGRAWLFTPTVHRWIFLGITFGVVEAGWRFRENVFRGVPLADVRLRGAVYGWALLPLAWLVRTLVGARGAESTTSFDGYYGGQEHFDGKLERDRRYGSVYKLEDRDDAYLLRVEFPRALPPSSLADELKLPPEMPDYDYDLRMENGSFVVHAKVTDPQVRKLTAVAPAFPPEFTTRVPLRDSVTGFKPRYRDKTLEVILLKAAG
jgi:ferredoxin